MISDNIRMISDKEQKQKRALYQEQRKKEEDTRGVPGLKIKSPLNQEFLINKPETEEKGKKSSGISEENEEEAKERRDMSERPHKSLDKNLINGKKRTIEDVAIAASSKLLPFGFLIKLLPKGQKNFLLVIILFLVIAVIIASSLIAVVIIYYLIYPTELIEFLPIWEIFKNFFPS